MVHLCKLCFQVLYADGTVSVHTGPWDLPKSRSSSPQRLNSAKSQEQKPDTPTKDKKGGIFCLSWI